MLAPEHAYLWISHRQAGGLIFLNLTYHCDLHVGGTAIKSPN